MKNFWLYWIVGTLEWGVICGAVWAGQPDAAFVLGQKDYERAARVEGRVASFSRSDLTGGQSTHGFSMNISVVWDDPIRVIHPPKHWDIRTFEINGQGLPDVKASTRTRPVQALGWQTYRDTYLGYYGKYHRGVDGTFYIERLELEILPETIDRLTASGEFAFARAAESITADWIPHEATAAVNDDWNLSLLTADSDVEMGPGIVNVRLERQTPRASGAFPDPAIMDDVPVGIWVFDIDGELIHRFDELRWSDSEAMKAIPGKEIYSARPLVTDQPLPPIHRVRVDFIPGLERRRVTVDVKDLKPPHTGAKPSRLDATITVSPPLEALPPQPKALRLTAFEWDSYTRPDEQPDPEAPGRLSLSGLYDPSLVDDWRLLTQTFVVTHLAERETDLLQPPANDNRRDPPLPKLPETDALSEAISAFRVGDAILQHQRNPNLTNLSRWSTTANLTRQPTEGSLNLGVTAIAIRNGEVTTVLTELPAVGESHTLSPHLSLWRRPDTIHRKRQGLVLSFKLEGVAKREDTVVAPAVPVRLELVSRDDPPRSLGSIFSTGGRTAGQAPSSTYHLIVPPGVDVSLCQLKITWAKDLEMKVLKTEPQSFLLKELPGPRGF